MFVHSLEEVETGYGVERIFEVQLEEAMVERGRRQPLTGFVDKCFCPASNTHTQLEGLKRRGILGLEYIDEEFTRKPTQGFTNGNGSHTIIGFT